MKWRYLDHLQLLLSRAKSPLTAMAQKNVCSVVVVFVYLTLTDSLRIQPWSQDRRNQTKSNREHVRKNKERGKQTEENGQESSQQRTLSSGRDTEETKSKNKYVKRVLPREVAQAVKVSTTLDSTEWGRECRQGAASGWTRCFCALRGERSQSTTGNLPSMHMFRRYLSGTTIIVLTCSPQYSPLFASRACDTVETGLI